MLEITLVSITINLLAASFAIFIYSSGSMLTNRQLLQMLASQDVTPRPQARNKSCLFPCEKKSLRIHFRYDLSSSLPPPPPSPPSPSPPPYCIREICLLSNMQIDTRLPMYACVLAGWLSDGHLSALPHMPPVA